ncbi:MAG: hypothetical protein ABIN96_00205 [Rubrivivax sp.]
MIGAIFGFEASSFFSTMATGPASSKVFIVIDPAALAGHATYLERMKTMVSEMLRDAGIRLPGAWREALRQRAEVEGTNVPDALLKAWRVTSADNPCNDADCQNSPQLLWLMPGRA